MKEHYMEVLSRKQMGHYLTAFEEDFISRCLQGKDTIHHILDVGGGTGRIAIPLHNKGYQVTVTEIHPLALHRLKVHCSDIDSVLTGKRTPGWSIKDSAVDCVLAIQVHVVFFDWFWSECRRVLKPGGIVILTASNSSSYRGLFHKLGESLQPTLLKGEKYRWRFGGYYPMSTRAFIQKFEEEGFRLRRALGYKWTPAGQDSDLFLVPLFMKIERKLNLGRFIFQSPSVIYEVSIG